MQHVRELNWLRETVGVLCLDDRAIIAVSGDDAHEWLQGQISNQCEGAQPGDAVYGFVLTLKGRVLADVWALFHDDGIWLEVHWIQGIVWQPILIYGCAFLNTKPCIAPSSSWRRLENVKGKN